MDKKYVKLVRENWLAGCLLTVLLVSFFYGWFIDSSKPRGGGTWTDQSVYTKAATRLAHGDLPTRNQMHYSVGYPLMGALGYYVFPSDPFMPVSFVLIMGSLVFCFFGAKRLVGKWWAALFTVLLFMWDGRGRTFQFSSDLFSVPWNNQVLFFAFAFFFWLLSTKNINKSYKALIGASLVSGVTVLTREESVLFMAPLMAVYLLLTKANWKRWLTSFAIVVICLMPQLIIKNQVFSSVSSTGRGKSYSSLADNYLRPDYFVRNVKETLFFSGDVGKSIGRDALFQAAPWLLLGFAGISVILISNKYPPGIKYYALIATWLTIFYLAGVNMSAHKLQFHCLRYISPAFIILNFGVVIAAKELLAYIRTSKKDLTVSKVQ